MNDNASDLGILRARTADMSLLHPKVQANFLSLNYRLALAHKRGDARTLFRPFETYCHPLRQDAQDEASITRYRRYLSPKNYGLGVEYAAWQNGKWSWATTHDWQFLYEQATVCNLSHDHEDVPIGQIISPEWRRLQSLLRALF